MASTSPNIKQEAAIPFWRDVRVLGVLAQVVFVILVFLGFRWLIVNFLINADNQGLEIGFEFLNTTAAFDIAEGIEYESTDTFGRALWVGVINTIRVSFIGIVLTTFLGIIVGIARLSNNWLVSRIATVYIEIIRNVPLLVLLFFIYFAVILKLPAVRDSVQLFGLPVFLNNRGVAMPGLKATSGFPIWLAFVVLAIILVMALWTMLSRQEERTGEPVGKFTPSLIAFVIVAIASWYIVGAFTSNQAIMVPTATGVQEFEDFERIYLQQIDEDALLDTGYDRLALDRVETIQGVADLKTELSEAIAIVENSGEDAAVLESRLDILDDAEIVLCTVEDSVSEVNAASQLRRQGIPVKVSNENSIRKAGALYASGECDLLAGTQAELASERSILEEPTGHELLAISVAPMVVNTPAPAGFNIQGGTKLTPEFAALLLGLVMYTGAFAAEIVRAGILAVSKGQSEAARALGLNEGQRLRLIVLPQALRVIIPPMTSQYLNLTKNSSLAVAIAYPDLVAVGNTVMNQSGFAVQVILIFMTSYLTLSLSISAFLNWYNNRVALVER